MRYRSPSHSQPRRGIVLVAVLVVVTVLALAAYQYTELMSAEFKAADGNTRAAQTRAAAMSGVHYTAALLSDPTFFTGTLNSNPFDNAQYFQDILVHDDPNPKKRLHFTVLCLRAPDDPQFQSQPFRFGVEDEASKINVNALLKYDKTGTLGLQILQGLPNMTDDCANSILDWVDNGSASPRSGGAKDETYMSMTPPYHCKNGPLDSIDEMLLINGMTTDLLYGNDTNFNGQLDAGETGGSGAGGVDRGWSPYLTVYSREANVSSTSTPPYQARVYINDKSITTLQTNLATAFANGAGNSQDLINFIVAYRMYGPAASAGGGAKGGATPYKPLSSGDKQAATAQLSADVTKAATSSSGGGKLTAISSLYSLINATVSVKTGSGKNAKTITLVSPLRDPSQQVTLLPMLLDFCTTSQNPDLTPRINVNTASEAVLMTLVKQTAQTTQTTPTTGTGTGTGTAQTGMTPQQGGLQVTDVQAIVASQPQYSSGDGVDATYDTTAWLITKAMLAPQTVQSIEPFITARSTVYRFQVLGYFEGGGPVTRLEAVVDTNFGRPRIVYVRNLTELGKVFDMTQIQLNQ